MTNASPAPQANHIIMSSPAELRPMGSLPAYHAARDGSRGVVTIDGVTTSRADFAAGVNRRARILQQNGVQERDFVTLAIKNSLEFYETTFALWKLGATPNPVSASLPEQELRAIVDLVRPRLVIGAQPGKLGDYQTIPGGAALDTSVSAEPLDDKVAPFWKAMTSGGSTGRPKVIVDHNPGLWDPNVAPLRQEVNDVLLNPGPLYHNAPFSLIHTGLLAGGHVIEMGKFDAERALELIDRYGVNWVNFVPTMMHRIARLPEATRAKFDLSSLRIVYHMASACPPWLKQQWIDWLGPDKIWELYGGTERQGATEIGGADWLQHRGSVGRPQANCTMRVLAEDGSSCAPGEIGEIFFLPEGGRNATYHYLGAEAKASGDWESIGDLGYLDEDGFLYLVDRRTDLIISGGANVYPAEVEAALDAHADVLSSIVIGLPEEDLGQRVHALVQLRPGVAPDEASLRDFLSQQIARFKIPRTFEFLSEPLRDDAGKARRSALRAQRMQSQVSGDA